MCEIKEICDEGEEDCNSGRDDDGAALVDPDDPDVKTTSIPPEVIGIVVGLVLLLVAAFVVYFTVCRKKKTGTLPVSSAGDQSKKKTRNVNV